MDRLGLFLFYDSEGIVDDYVRYLLDDMSQHLSHLCIIVNGDLKAESRIILEKYTHDIILRSNLGFDVGAWKDAMIEEFGFEKLAEYDEVILFNDSFFGPIYPFSEMFDEMNKRDLDFWAITVHGAAPDPRNLCPYPHRPRYLQLYFLVFRRQFVQSKEFQDYWKNMPYYENFNDVGYKHQAVFTKHFSDLGFKWAAYADTEELEESVEKSLSFHTYDMYEMVKDKRLPVIKRKAFKLPRKFHLIFNSSMDIPLTMAYIKENTDYDVSLIYDYYLRTIGPSELATIMGLKQIIPQANGNADYKSDKRIAFVLQINHVETLDHVFRYVRNLPENVDIFITTDKESKKDMIENEYLSGMANKSEVILIEQSHDMSCLFITCRNVVDDYDYFCFMSDRKPDIYDYLTIRTSYIDILWDNMLRSPEYINTIIRELDEDDNLGLVVPPTPYHGEYFKQYASKYWDTSFVDVENLHKRMNLSAALNSEDYALSAANAFWAKSDALRPLFDLELTHDDFFKLTEGKSSMDHAMERIYPYVAAHQRYYTKTVMSEEYAINELTNYQYMANETVSMVREHSGDIVRFDKTFNVFLNTMRKGLIDKNKFRQLKKANVIEGSTSWKITKPLRKMGDLARKIRK